MGSPFAVGCAQRMREKMFTEYLIEATAVKRRELRGKKKRRPEGRRS
jgi:hypothetical protein